MTGHVLERELGEECDLFICSSDICLRRSQIISSRCLQSGNLVETHGQDTFAPGHHSLTPNAAKDAHPNAARKKPLFGRLTARRRGNRTSRTYGESVSYPRTPRMPFQSTPPRYANANTTRSHQVHRRAASDNPRIIPIPPKTNHSRAIPVRGPNSPRLYLLRSNPDLFNLFISQACRSLNSAPAILFLTPAFTLGSLPFPSSCMISASSHDHENSLRSGRVWLFGWMAEKGFW